MKIHDYVIKHSKLYNGIDVYSIYNVWFGFLKIPFFETEVSSGICASYKKYLIRHKFYGYSSVEQAKDSLMKYVNEPYVLYKGHKLTRFHNDIFVDLNSGEKPRPHDWLEYKIGGALDKCKVQIDEIIQEEQNKKFVEYIKI